MTERSIKSGRKELSRIPSTSDSAARWHVESAAAIVASNMYVETHGLPLEKFRQF